jgi:hypothetical protein
VLPVEAKASSHDSTDSFDLGRFLGIAVITVANDGCEQVALSDGFRRIRIDVVRGTLLQGPVRLHYLLSGFGDLDGRVLTLRRLASLQRLGRFARALYPPELRAPRWIHALRTHDALAAGASQREISAVLFGDQRAHHEWRTNSDSPRLRIQRLVRSARAMVAGGYLRLLP